MRRQLVASGAAVTTALAVGLALPAIAQSEPELFEGNVTCVELEEEGFIEGLIESIKIDPAADEDNEFFTADLHGDGTGTLLDVVAKDGFTILAVIIKGGPDSNVYFSPPFTDLHAPEVPGGIPEISHYEVCIGEEEEETTPPTSPPTSPPTTETPTPTIQPTTPVETPAPVPTEVPAGSTDGGSSSAGLFGLVLAGGAAAAGVALVVRRRFLHDS
jgi:hypothetical protein